MERQIIINADDFGSYHSINMAIRDSYLLKFITSATIMANMPGFDEAIKIMNDLKMNHCVGIHLNLTLEKPLTNQIKNQEIFCDSDGNFRARSAGLISSFSRLNDEEMKCLELELNAQIIKCKDNGLFPCHIDSHQHIHTQWNISRIVLKVAKEQGIKKIRLARNVGEARNVNIYINWLKKIYKFSYNNNLHKNGFLTTDYFGSYDDFLKLATLKKFDSSIFEIMCHPVHKNSLLVDGDVSLENQYFELKNRFPRSEYISYNDI